MDARPARSARRPYIDWARGLAVLLMIEAHTLDAWTRAGSRSGTAFAYAGMLGGGAAPLFLWLAGVALVLSAASVERRTGSRAGATDAICRRGLEIFVLAFLFRLQAFIVSPGSPPVTLFRVDILNVMGPSIVAAGLVWGVTSGAWRVATLSILATAIGLVTPTVRGWPAIDALPTIFQWYIRPAGDYTTFTAFPWAGFVFAGAAVGSLLAAAREPRVERTLQWALAAAGVSIAALGWYTSFRPSLYLHSSFWTSSPAFYAIRIGLMMATLAAFYVASLAGDRAVGALGWLERFGRSSLFVYWIHIELVYGYTSWFWRRSLPLWGTAIAYCIFAALMYRAVVAKENWAAARNARRAAAGPQPVVA